MKKPIAALAVLSAFAGTAAAQPDVKLYGVADVAFVHNDGISAAGSVNKLESGQDSTVYNKSGSRLGVQGSEDLGNGLSAIFALEMGINVDTGTSDQGGTTFGRQAFIGLKSSELGAVKLGRQYNPLYNATSAIDPFAAGMAGALSRLISVGGGPNGKRVNNAVTYLTPSSLGGFKAEALYGFGETGGDSSQLREAGFSVGYANGPLSVSAAYHNANQAYNTVATATLPVGMNAAAVTATNVPASIRSTAFGGTYDFGAVKLAALYQQNKNTAPATLPNTDTRDALIGATVPLNEKSRVLFSYIRHQDRATADGNSNQVAVGYNYDLSKSTNLYTAYSRLANDANAQIAVANKGQTDKLFVAGIMYKF